MSVPLATPIRPPSSDDAGSPDGRPAGGSSPKLVAAMTVPRLIDAADREVDAAAQGTMVWPVAASISVMAAAVSRLSSSSVNTPSLQAGVDGEQQRPASRRGSGSAPGRSSFALQPGPNARHLPVPAAACQRSCQASCRPPSRSWPARRIAAAREIVGAFERRRQAGRLRSTATRSATWTSSARSLE